VPPADRYQPIDGCRSVAKLPFEASPAVSWKESSMPLRRYIIERDIPKVGTFERDQLRAAAAKSNEVLGRLGPDIQWQESFVVADKTFCVYLAKDEAIIRKHAELSGFPATTISEVRTVIDPTTERAG
jgi:hypothetical protein